MTNVTTLADHRDPEGWIAWVTRRPPEGRPIEVKLPWSDEACSHAYARIGDTLYVIEPDGSEVPLRTSYENLKWRSAV